MEIVTLCYVLLLAAYGAGLAGILMGPHWPSQVRKHNSKRLNKTHRHWR